MKPIIAPLDSSNQGPKVVNLQEGLALLLSYHVVETERGTREDLLQKLSEEARQEQYKDTTAKVVRLFQKNASSLPQAQSIRRPPRH